MRADEGYELDRPTSAYGTTRTSHEVRFSAASEGKADFERVRLRSPGL